MDPGKHLKRSHSAFLGQAESTNANDQVEEESTDLKLALLASLVPDATPDILMDTLLLSNGAVEEAARILNYGSTTTSHDGLAPRAKQAARPYATDFGAQSDGTRKSTGTTFMQIPENVTLIETPKRPKYVSTGSAGSPRRSGSSLYQSSLSSFVSGMPSKPNQKLLTRKGRTLHLFTPAEIAMNTPCSLIPNFLPSDLADALLQELLQEAPTFGKDTFQLFDQIVTSPHTMAFYVDDLETVRDQQTSYIYNGATVRDIRQTPQVMLRVSEMVKHTVNSEIEKRIQTHFGGKRLKYMSDKPWAPNASFVNCYDGGKESVGYHADQLTYLGPRAVIGSLSLGVAREFRVRRMVPKPSLAEDNDGDAARSISEEDKKAEEKRLNDAHADAQGQIAIHLPHNSLLIMHADMQEEWKHSIAPAPSIEPHPIAGNKRLNITYRFYRKSFHPQFTPKCRCGVPCVLRSAFKSEKNRGRYMWMCHSGYTPGKDTAGCGFFEWAVFDDVGEPPWAWDKNAQTEANTEDDRKANSDKEV